jgi:cyclophilin family peptidyl-prolyl cis-trans isomerase
MPKRLPSGLWALLVSASFCVLCRFAAIPSYPLGLILRTMRSFILNFFALLAAARGIAASPSPSGSPASSPDGLYAKITTPRGIIIAHLFDQDAPLTITNFVGLAEGTLGPNPGKPFYDGLTFHRVVSGFVIQGGDPLGTGEGDPGYEFPDEFSPKLRHDSIGVLSMANSGPDTNGCQFFITLDAENQLNYLHSVFGKVVSGLEVLPQVQQGDKMEVKILRLGASARAFRADQAAFNQLVAKASRATFPHFSDDEQILPTVPPREKGFDNKLSNFERFTGVKIYARVFEAFHPSGSRQTRSDVAKLIAQQLGVERNGVTALYFADTRDWELVIGDGPLKAVSKAAEISALAEWKKSLQVRATETSEKLIALAEKRAPADKPLNEAQRNYIRVAAMLEELVEVFSPKAMLFMGLDTKWVCGLLISGLRIDLAERVAARRVGH